MAILRSVSTMFLCAALVCACERPKSASPPAPAAPEVDQVQRPPVRLAVPPPDLPAGLSLGAQPSDKLDVTVVRLGRLPISLGRTRMPDLEADIGAGVVDDQGDGADWKSWLCYTVPGVERIWLVSGAQGSGDFVGSIAAVADATARAEDHCPALPAAYRPIAIDPDVWLRTPETRIDRLYGAAPATTEGWRVYARQRHRREDNLEFDESVVLALKFENGRVVEVRASKQVTS
ncbi:MAG TPA: hypothetical protein VG841_13975 [Caulobacterales bacterium]|nr:hypothetical protein [Caulobacterales bacterium]